MAIGAKYGFKLTGVTIPDDTTSLNAVISDGTTPAEYVLTGSVANGFSGTGASATAPKLKVNENVTITSQPYNIDTTVSTWLYGLSDEELTQNDVYVNGTKLTYDGSEGMYIFSSSTEIYVITVGENEGDPWRFAVFDGELETIIPGTYQLSIYDGSSAFNLTIDTLTESDVGDTYNVTLSTSAVEENFKSAVENVLVDNGLIGATDTLFDGTITITDGVVEIPFDMDVSGYPFKDWTVEVNNVPLSYNGKFFEAQYGNLTYVVGSDNGAFMFGAYEGEWEWISGDYQVKITGIAGAGGIPTPGTDGTILYSRNGNWASGLPIDENADSGFYAIQMRLGDTGPEFAGWKKIPGIVTSGVIGSNGIYLVVTDGFSSTPQVININRDGVTGGDYYLTFNGTGSSTISLKTLPVPSTIPSNPGNYVLKVSSGGAVEWVAVT